MPVSLHSAAVLIDALRGDDLMLRKNAIVQMSTICEGIGPDRTREELMPFLEEMVEDEVDGSEVLEALAEELGRGIPYVGGVEFAHHLLPCLELLSITDEAAVRDKAVESLKKVVNEMSYEDATAHFWALIQRLAGREWFTSRIAACDLLPHCVEKLPIDRQAELMSRYVELCEDSVAMVRRSALRALKDLIAVVQPNNIELLLSLFKSCMEGTDLISLRTLAVENSIALGEKCTPQQFHDSVMPVVRSCQQDFSWRVRFTFADNMHTLVGMAEDPDRGELVRMYQEFLGDAEADVRSAAARRLPAVAKAIPDKEWFMTTIKETLDTLVQDSAEHVRVSFAAVLLSLAPLMGQQTTVNEVLPVVLQLMRDEKAEVKLALVGTLSELSTVMGIEMLKQSLIPQIGELIEDKQWRIREAVLQNGPVLARHLGEASFTDDVCPLMLKLCMDTVSDVRLAAAQCLRQLTNILGEPWMEVNVVNHVQEMATNESSYLIRIAALNCILELHDVISENTVVKCFIPLIVNLAKDPVPNVRFNANSVALTLSKKLTESCVQQHLRPVFVELTQDPDVDVKYYAVEALHPGTGVLAPAVV
mmetsp:Transcript_65918/g.151005  ORF Transcript_65918/g.151005 Transcript_65918/m.151005 type:complete len:591 (-) Transcript_65918:122-1894(-)